MAPHLKAKFHQISDVKVDEPGKANQYFLIYLRYYFNSSDFNKKLISIFTSAFKRLLNICSMLKKYFFVQF